MSNTSIVLLSFIIIFVLLILVLVLFRISKKESQSELKKQERSLDDFLQEALTLRGTALQELIEEFIKTQKLPYKQNETLSLEAKKKLEFVHNVALNPNSTAKHISFLNRGLVKLYGIYKTDIEAYEQLGVEQRKSRQKQ